MSQQPDTILEPIGRFTLGVILVHGLLGAGLWYWMSQANGEPRASPSEAWVSPESISAEIAAEIVQAPPMNPNLLQLGTGVPEASSVEALPMAVSIDPAVALAQLEGQQARPSGSTETQAGGRPVLASTNRVLSESQPASEPPAPTPAPEPPTLPEITRFVTVSHPSKKQRSDAPAQVARLADLASLDAEPATSSNQSPPQSPRLDDVDRAVIEAFMKTWSAPKPELLAPNERTAHLDVAVNRKGRMLDYKLARTSGSADLDVSVLEAADRIKSIAAKFPSDYPSERYDFQVNFYVE
jgi:periplasmic protein TonB